MGLGIEIGFGTEGRAIWVIHSFSIPTPLVDSLQTSLYALSLTFSSSALGNPMSKIWSIGMGGRAFGRDRERVV